MASSEVPAVVAAALCRWFGPGRGLAPIDLQVAGGEAVGFVGPSGSGKTTLFRLLYGALRPSAGSLRVLGADPPSLPPGALRGLRRRIGVVPQSHGLIPTLTVAQNVAIGLAGRRPAPAALAGVLSMGRRDRQAVHSALARLAIAELIDRRVDQLSGGQQQRVAVARALIQGPDLLIADEPVASVDGTTARVVMTALAEFAAGGGALLVSLHQAELAGEFCSRTVTVGAAPVGAVPVAGR